MGTPRTSRVILALVSITPTLLAAAPSQAASVQTIVGTAAPDLSYSMAQDGNTLVYGVSKGKYIWRASTERSERIRGVSRASGVLITPDGRNLLISRSTASKLDLSIRNLRSGVTRKLPTGRYQPNGWGMSATGRFVPAARGFGGRRRPQGGVLDTQSGRFVALPEGPRRYSGQVVTGISGDGRWITYWVARYNHPTLAYLFNRETRRRWQFTSYADQAPTTLSDDASSVLVGAADFRLNPRLIGPGRAIYRRTSRRIIPIPSGDLGSPVAMDQTGRKTAFVCGNELFTFDVEDRRYSRVAVGFLPKFTAENSPASMRMSADGSVIIIEAARTPRSRVLLRISGSGATPSSDYPSGCETLEHSE